MPTGARAMRSKPVAALLVDLDITKSHSRPHVSDDNPYSESQFKTMKYRPDFPARFGCIEDARLHCQEFFAWYNTEHRHSGIGYMTPQAVHYGRAPGAARDQAGRPRCRIPGLTEPLQRPSANTLRAAHSRVDQPATIGDQQPENIIDLHSKFMTPGAAKSLTRSDRSGIPFGLLHCNHHPI